jgi:hypothetical protein
MKINVEIEMTPQELREFLGLPDVSTVQEYLVGELKRNIENGAEGYDPVALLRPFFPAGAQAMEATQKMVLDAWARQLGVGDRPHGDEPDGDK